MINYQKHILQIQPDTVTSLTNKIINIASVESAPADSNPSTVSIGTKIIAVFIELWLLSNSTTVSSGQAVLIKGAGGDEIEYLEQLDLHNYQQKKNVLHITQGLVGEFNSNPTPFFRGWYKIPKGKQRFGQGDKLYLAIADFGTDVQFCGVVVYKAMN